MSQKVRAALAAANVQLEPGHPMAGRLHAVLHGLERGKTYDGQPAMAAKELRKIIVELRKDTRVKHGTALGVAKLKQSGKRELPANIEAAIGRINDAVAKLAGSDEN